MHDPQISQISRMTSWGIGRRLPSLPFAWPQLNLCNLRNLWMLTHPRSGEVCRVGIYRFSVVIEKDADGYYAYCPEVQGCYTQGNTYEEAIENIRDAIRLHGEDRLESGETIPQPEAVSLTSLEVAV